MWSFSIGWGCDKLITAADLAPVRSALATAHANGTTAFNASGDLAGLECKGGQDWSSPPSDADIGLDSVASLPEMTDVGGTTLSTDAARRVAVRTGLVRRAAVAGQRRRGVRVVRPAAVAAWRCCRTETRAAGSPRMSPRSPTRSPACKIVFNGKQLVGGGTSQSAPIWAGLAAVMNQYLVAERRTADSAISIPLLYKVAEGSRLPGFRDVTLGGNAVADAGPATTW